MQQIYMGLGGERLGVSLAIELDRENRAFGWLFGLHPNGEWVTLANLRPFASTIQNPPETKESSSHAAFEGLKLCTMSPEQVTNVDAKFSPLSDNSLELIRRTSCPVCIGAWKSWAREYLGRPINKVTDLPKITKAAKRGKRV